MRDRLIHIEAEVKDVSDRKLLSQMCRHSGVHSRITVTADIVVGLRQATEAEIAKLQRSIAEAKATTVTSLGSKHKEEDIN